MCDGSAAAGGRRVGLSGRQRWSQHGLPTGGQGEGARAEAGAPPRRPRISQKVLMCSQPKGDRRADEISGLGGYSDPDMKELSRGPDVTLPSIRSRYD